MNYHCVVHALNVANLKIVGLQKQRPMHQAQILILH